MSANGYYGGVSISMPAPPPCHSAMLGGGGGGGGGPLKCFCRQCELEARLRLARYVEANQPPLRRQQPPPAGEQSRALTATGGSAAAAAAATMTASSGSAATLWTLVQVMAAFLVAGFGNVGAGLILGYVQEWPVFLHVNELFILVPSLLGLKGNLEMTMAARLSTQANLGHMDNLHELVRMAKGNLALVQCQATVVSFVVALFASFVKALTLAPVGDLLSMQTGNLVDFAAGSNSTLLASNLESNATTTSAGTTAAAAAASNEAAPSTAAYYDTLLANLDWDNTLVLCASSILTANIACFVLGTLMILVIAGSHRLHIDPDNIAAPVAASLGDMTTAALLAVIAHSIYQYTESQEQAYLALTITLLFLFMLPVWVCVAKNNPYTSSVLSKGWTPIVIAVFISSCGGFILEYGKSRFSRLPVFQPVINGVGGNLVAVQASRLSTALHRQGKPGHLPAHFKLFTGPLELFFGLNSKQRQPPTSNLHQSLNQLPPQEVPALSSSSSTTDLTRAHSQRANFNTARLLLFLSLPAHILYFFVIRLVEGDNRSVPVTALFLGLYMLLALLQVAILLYLAQNLVHLLWRCSIDPDNYSTPLLTATGDLLGCAFLLVVFLVAYHFNDPYAVTVV